MAGIATAGAEADKGPSVKEANQIMQGNQVREDRVGQLVDMVYKKGEEASFRMISILKQKDQYLSEKLKLETKTGERGMDIDLC